MLPQNKNKVQAMSNVWKTVQQRQMGGERNNTVYIFFFSRVHLSDDKHRMLIRYATIWLGLSMFWLQCSTAYSADFRSSCDKRYNIHTAIYTVVRKGRKSRRNNSTSGAHTTWLVYLRFLDRGSARNLFYLTVTADAYWLLIGLRPLNAIVSGAQQIRNLWDS